MKKPLHTLIATHIATLALALTVPTVSAGLFDIDSDGIRNNIDLDIDGDGIPDEIERDYGLSPYWSPDGASDMDGDGWTNAEEYRFVTDLEDANSNPDTVSQHPMQRVFPAYGEGNLNFGTSVAIDGDTLAVGDTGLQTSAFSGNYIGGVSVFTNSAGLWQPQEILTADQTGGGSFGARVDVQDDTLVVSAYRENTDVEDGGAVYVFTNSQGDWVQQARLTVPGLDAYDNLGYQVALAGDQLLVGCPYCDNGKGRVYVFDRDGSNWTMTDTLTNCAEGSICTFGIEIKVNGDRAVITAPHYNTNEEYGKAYVYQRNNGSWSLEAELVSNYSTDPSWYGSEADINGDTVLVADTWVDIMGKVHGSTYEFVLENGTWTEGSVFYAADFGMEALGHDVALASGRAILSGPGIEPGVGVVIELVRSGGSWVEAGRSYSDAGYYAEDEFGDAIDLNSSGSKAAVGANWADDASSNGGVAYVISYPMPM